MVEKVDVLGPPADGGVLLDDLLCCCIVIDESVITNTIVFFSMVIMISPKSGPSRLQIMGAYLGEELVLDPADKLNKTELYKPAGNVTVGDIACTNPQPMSPSVFTCQAPELEFSPGEERAPMPVIVSKGTMHL